MSKTATWVLSSVLACAGLCGCGDDGEASGSGSVSVVIESEDSITNGLDAGDGVENIRDGWQVRFDKYLIAIGDIDMHFAADEGRQAEDARVFVVDLKSAAQAGLPLWSLHGLQSGRWEFFYSTPGAADGATRHDSVSEVDFESMRAGDLTYLVAGTLTKGDGRSCPPPALAKPPETAASAGANSAGHACYANPTVTFRIGAEAETVFGPCEVDGLPGVSVTNDSTQTVATTIHGDHLFFNGFPEGDEGGVLRLAQWLADCDLNVDGEVTREELETVAPSALAEIDSRYQLGGSPITPLDNMWKYLTGQLKTQGHMNGEGECPFDGQAHEH